MNELNLEAIRQARKKMHVTFQEMAVTLGLKNASTYMRYEKGVYKFRAEHIPLLAKKLNLTVNDIFLSSVLLK